MWMGRSASAGSRAIHSVSPSRSKDSITAHRAPFFHSIAMRTSPWVTGRSRGALTPRWSWNEIMSWVTPRRYGGDDGRARAGRILHVREAHASRALGAGQFPHAVAHALG